MTEAITVAAFSFMKSFIHFIANDGFIGTAAWRLSIVSLEIGERQVKSILPEKMKNRDVSPKKKEIRHMITTSI